MLPADVPSVSGLIYVVVTSGRVPESVHGDIWEPDPACYLTDEEIGLLADVPLAVK